MDSLVEALKKEREYVNAKYDKLMTETQVDAALAGDAEAQEKALYENVNKMMHDAQRHLANFHRTVQAIAAAGFSTVIQKDNTLYVYRDEAQECGAYTRTTRTAFGKLFEEKK